MALCRSRLVKAREGYEPASTHRAWADHLTLHGYPVDWHTIQRWENGKNRIPADYILIVAQVTRTSPTFLFSGLGARQW